uniref:RRM domain-containing protein n=1 Tax=Zea mays TaxID=4577 RepID=A0A804PWK8_MAIZE
MAMASQCAPSVPPNRSANNGVQRQRRGDDVRDTALLEPSKQPSVTFSVKNSWIPNLRRMLMLTITACTQSRTFYRVTEENLAALFINCGQVVDCRMCGDPNSVLRFAFIEFTDEEGARAALNLSGTVLGYYLVNSDDECEMCARTIYCTNIDKKVTQADLKLFFESICDRSGDQQDHGLHQV